jgi:hypothetical protein
MREILIFGEDFAHEKVAENLVRRVSHESGTDIRLAVRSCRRGFGTLVSELGSFSRDVADGEHALPDMFLVITDANCKGLKARSKEVEAAVPEELQPFLVCLIPDPHVERWLLLDSHAFKDVLGHGCAAPDHKCERDRYKTLLRQAVSSAGVTPQLGGLEYADDLMAAMDLQRAEDADSSFRKALQQLRGFYARWKAEEDGQ